VRGHAMLSASHSHIPLVPGPGPGHTVHPSQIHVSIRLRYAPSPTGYLHIGGARTALFNWAYARRMGGTFIVRVEDTDRARSTDEYEQAVLEGLRWLGIDWDEGPGIGGPHAPYRQTERFDGYAQVAQRLFEQGHAYRCFCSSERLTEVREKQMAAKQTAQYDKLCRDLDAGEVQRRLAAGEPAVLRFRVPLEGRTTVKDLVSGDVSFNNNEVDDWVMVRMDGTPTYNFCVVCDDSDMEITHVLRGEEHLTNTPKQVLLFQALGLEPPAYAHLPLMLGKDKKKLSKRTGDTSLQDYQAKGYPPAAVVNFLCLQGWSLDDKTTIFSPQELVDNFEPQKVSRGGSVFDPDKFLWMAGEYVHAEEVAVLAGHCAPYVQAAGQMSEPELEERSAWFERAVASERERIKLYSDLPQRLAYLFVADDAVEYAPKAMKNALKHADGQAILGEFTQWLEPRLVADFDVEQLRADARDWVGSKEIGFGLLFQPLRCVLTGAAGGADIFDSIGLLGGERTLTRLKIGLQRLWV
jgi:glutamyl-tRNA synthetase